VKKTNEDTGVNISPPSIVVHREANEHHVKIDWIAVPEDAVQNAYAEVLTHDSGFNPFTLADQMILAAKGQPGAVFAVKAGALDLPLVIKFENNSLFLGSLESSPDAFGSLEGPDGDGDEDDQTNYIPGTPAVESVVKKLLSTPEQITELSWEEAEKIALDILGEDK